jgi:hypothetical protein
MAESKYLYFKEQFTKIEVELEQTLNNTYDFFKNYDDINPADSTLKMKNIMEKIAELKQKDYDLRIEIRDQQFDITEEVINEDSIINIEENEQYKQILKDKIYMYNHHTSYGIILVIGICSMAFLSRQKQIVN